jgi:hypothetical protein
MSQHLPHPDIDIDRTPYPDIWRGWYAQRRVVYFYFGNGKRTNMEAAVGLVAETIEAWSPTKPFRVVYDVTNAFMSPYARRAAEEVYELIPTHFVNSRTVIMLPDTISGNLFRNLIERFMRVHNPEMQRRFFTDHSAAIQWVSAELDA